ncbi:MAG: O-antigen ligase family protein [Chitinophagales bacterium]|nr:O-antigen ligase family protein [Chitinophagales bacterium]
MLNRTAILAAIAFVLFLLYPIIRNKNNQRTVLAVVLFIFLGVIFLLAVFFKVESTSGRWFILQKSFYLFKDHWLKGVGYGKFNPNFNHLQAEYFSTHSLVSKEAMLANDGYFAFNEWLHFAIELGVVGLAISLLVTWVILKACIMAMGTPKAWAGALMMAILVACMFSYPLHDFFIVAIAALLAGYLAKDIIKIPFRVSFRLQVSFVTVLILLLLYFSYKYYNYQQEYSAAKENREAGFKTEAIGICKKIAPEIKKNYSFTIFYLELLYETNRLGEAIQWFNDFHPYHCNQRAHTIVAKCFDESGNYSKAEKEYLTALYITPHLLQSRADLVMFYDRYKRIDKATYWAQQLIDCPIKIENPKAHYLKKQAKNYLDSH